MKSYAIIGTGAIGGYFAVKLYQAGFDVHCLLSSDYEVVKQHGLTLISEGKEINAPVKAYHDAAEIPNCDVVIITLKTTFNSVLKTILPKVTNPNNLVIVMQNGIEIEREIADLTPATILGGSCLMKVNKTAPGIITHLGYNQVEIAQYFADETHAKITEIVKKVVNDFLKADLDASAEKNLNTMRWKKLAANIPVNGLNVVLNDFPEVLVNFPAGFELLSALTREVIDTGNRCGAQISEDFYQHRLNILESFKTMQQGDSSMGSDYKAKKPLELHAIYENTMNIAKKFNVKMPLTEMLYRELCYLNAKNLKKQ